MKLNRDYLKIKYITEATGKENQDFPCNTPTIN